MDAKSDSDGKEHGSSEGKPVTDKTGTSDAKVAKVSSEGKTTSKASSHSIEKDGNEAKGKSEEKSQTEKTAPSEIKTGTAGKGTSNNAYVPTIRKTSTDETGQSVGKGSSDLKTPTSEKVPSDSEGKTCSKGMVPSDEKAPSEASTIPPSVISIDSKITKDTAQRTIPDHPEPSTRGSSGAYLDFGQLNAPDDVTEARSDYTPIGIAKAVSEERLAISGKKRSAKSYGSRSDLGSNFVPPTIRMDEPPPTGSEPMQTTCKYCYKMIKTDVKFVAGEKTYVMCLLLFVLLLWPFLWVPFCIKSCKEAVHRCPNCGALLSRPR